MTYLRLTAIVVVALFISVSSAQAAELHLVRAPGSRTITVMLDTQGANINAIEGSIDLPGGASGVLLGETVVPLWNKRPTAPALSFSGVIPGGYTGANGVLFSLLPAQSGQMVITPKNMHAYLNDGAGTYANLLAIPLSTTVPGIGETVATPADTELPNFSELRIARDPTVFDNNWFVIFNAQDAGTGVTRYEVAERVGNDTENVDQLAWHSADSPVRLADQSRSSTVFVRVFDGAGNARIATLPPLNTRSTNPYAVLGGVALLLLVIAGVVVFKRARLRE